MSSNTMRFEKLLEAVPDALVGVDQKGVIRFVNRQSELLFGYDREQLIGKHIDMLVPELLWQAFAEHQEDYFSDPGSRSHGLDLELAGRRQDGTGFPINVSMSLIDTGDVLLAITGAGEVTRRRQAVAKAELLDAIVEYSDDAIASLTLGGVITSWNPAAERMYGYSAAEVIGRPDPLIPQERAGELEAVLARIKDGQHVEHAETTLVRKDGTAVPVSITAAPIRDGHGTVVGASTVHRDVTEQRRAFEAAQRLAAIVEGSDDAIIGETLEGIVTSWNPAAARMFGYSSGEIIGQSAGLLVPEDQAGQAKAVVATVSAGQHVEHVETFNVRKDGTVFPISLTVSPVRDADGAIVGASVICRDITEQRKAFETAQRFSALVRYSNDAISSSTLEGIITSWNPAAERLYGYSSEEIIGKSGDFLTPRDRAGEMNTILEEFKAGQTVHHFENTVARKDGTLVPVSVTLSVIGDEEGQVVGVSAIHRDMSERNKVLEVGRRIAAIVESTQDAIVSGSLDGTITRWNPAAERMFGYSSQEIVGKPAQFLQPEGTASDIQAAVARIKAGQPFERLESVRVRRDGTVFPVSLTISPLWDDGTLVGTSVIYRDMTEQVKTETALAKTSQQYRLLAENASDLVVLTSPDRVITWVSPSVTRTLGWDTEDLIGTRLADLVHPDDAAGTAALGDTVYSGQEITPALGGSVLRVRTGSGQYRWMSGGATAVKDESGADVGVVTGLRDVDDLVRAREEAEVDRAALRATADSLLDPHVRFDAVRDEAGQIVDFVFADANSAACAYNGIAHQDLIGTRMLEHYPAVVGAGLLQQYARVVETGEPLMLEDVIYPMETMGGQERHLDISAARVGDGLSYTWRDVTDRHAAAQWLAESQEHYRLLAENASDVVMRLGPDRRFEWVSGSVADVLGWAAPDLLGHVVEEFIHPDELAPFRHAVAGTSPESTASTEFRFRRSDGSYRWVLCHTRLKVDQDGAAVAFVGGLVDIEARKAVEAQELDRLETLERFQRLTVGRELKMLELKKEIETLKSLVRRDADQKGDKH